MLKVISRDRCESATHTSVTICPPVIPSFGGGFHYPVLNLTYANNPSPSTLDVHLQSPQGHYPSTVKMASPPPSIASFIAGQVDPSLGPGSDEDQAALLTCLLISYVVMPLLTSRSEGYVPRASSSSWYAFPRVHGLIDRCYGATYD
jgi:hypothetical protein